MRSEEWILGMTVPKRQRQREREEAGETEAEIWDRQTTRNNLGNREWRQRPGEIEQERQESTDRWT